MYDERQSNRVATLAVIAAVASLLMLAAAGPLYRMGLLDLTKAFNLLRWAAYGGVGTLVLALLAVIVAARRRTGMKSAVTAIVAGLIALAVPFLWLRQASKVPRIHDITTDTEQPPQFVAVVPLRVGATNPVQYGGPAIAEQQHQGYADITPLSLTVPPNQAFDRAVAAARKMGWEIVASDPAMGRIEAIDTTFWFGFKDDIVIRIAAAPSGSRVDVRSLSRVGLSDVGTNASRIRKYLSALKSAS
jgi:uncharacterized protein (DUF1499 family)